MATTTTIQPPVTTAITRPSATARSVVAFGVYAMLLGGTLTFAPGIVLGVLALPVEPDDWARVAGIVIMGIGLYDLVGARHELTPFMRATVFGRYAFAALMTLFVVLGTLPRPLLLFAAIDVATATWTAFALRHDARRS
jgi:hypothetical protein